MVTDHRPIIWLNSKKDPAPKVYRWILWLNEFDFSIEYIKGATQVFADALSRIDQINVINFTETLAWSREEVAQKQQQDLDKDMRHYSQK